MVSSIRSSPIQELPQPWVPVSNQRSRKSNFALVEHAQVRVGIPVILIAHQINTIYLLNTSYNVSRNVTGGVVSET